VAVKIKLKRMGKIRNPQYRIIIADARTKRDGRAIEEIGKYHPKENPSLIDVDSERAQYWLGVGAQPTEPVLAILKVTGDWQKFKGLPGAEGTLKTAEAKADKREQYDALLAEVHKEPKADATTPKKKSAKKSAAKKTTAKKADADKAADAKADEAAEAKADEATDGDKPEKKAAAKKTAAKAPAKKTAAKKSTAKKADADKADDAKADAADESASES
jgi:small subunit ribosomal protein S16